MGVIVRGFGHFIPSTTLTNAEIAKKLSITDQYILDKTGIEERTYSLEGATSDMIVAAAHDCLQRSGVSPKEIDCVLVASSTPDYKCPSTASVVHRALGTNHASGFDLGAGCAGYLYALQLATALLNS